MAPSWTYPPGPGQKRRRRPPKADRKLPGWTNNALVTGLILGLVTVILSGLVSYVVAERTTREQNQDAARQAVSSVQVQQVTKLQADAQSFYRALGYEPGMNTFQSIVNDRPAINAVINAQAAFSIDLQNVSDETASIYANQFYNYATQYFHFESWSYSAGEAPSQTTVFVVQTYLSQYYAALINRCGQLIEGRN